jgi:RNA ligase (TIGR02306 family)
MSYQRKLASVQVVEEVYPHTNADNLELIKVLGWQVVERKGQFKAGDKIVYLEIDSVCPVKEWSAFLEKYKYRVKTIRLRKELSQGLIVPLTVLEESTHQSQLNIGDDVTEILGVTKYESALAADEKEIGVQKCARVSTFPVHLGFNKTDEPRVQSNQEYIKLFRGHSWYATVKYDGTSSTYLMDPEYPQELIVCSRNLVVNKVTGWIPMLVTVFKAIRNKLCCRKRVRWAVDQGLYWAMAEKYDLQSKLSLYPHLVLQGEIYGPDILGNKLNVPEPRLAIFSIYDRKLGRYCTMKEIEEHCEILGLDMVEIDSKGDNFNFTQAELLAKAKGKYRNTSTAREGLVFRLQNQVEIEGHRASFKVINNEFLEKEK